jgi:transposase
MQNDRVKVAIRLRAEGHSMKSIAKELNAAQSSVSLWTREVQLTEEQLQRLRMNMHSPAAIEKRRQARLKSEATKRTANLTNPVKAPAIACRMEYVLCMF